MCRSRLLNQATDLLLEALQPHGAPVLDTRTRGKVRRALALVLDAVESHDEQGPRAAEREREPEPATVGSSGLPSFLGVPDVEGVSAEDEDGA